MAAQVPAVAQLLRDGLDLPSGATVLTGENGSGKSTVLEVVAAALGLNAEGPGRTWNSRPATGTSCATRRPSSGISPEPAPD